MIITFNDTIIEYGGTILDFPTSSTPTPTPSSTIKLLVLGDLNASTVATSIGSQLTTLGYSGFTTSGVTMGTTFSGTGLNPNNYNCILYYTNSSQTGANALTTSLLNYVSLGGHLITGVFTWNLRPANWNYSGLTNFVGGVNQTSNNTNITVLQSHPIFNGVSSAITNNTSYFVNDIVNIQPGSTTLANFSSNSRPFLAIRTIGTANLVSINTFPSGISTYSNMRRLFTNSVLWVTGIIT
jgi:hypothetical protein